MKVWCDTCEQETTIYPGRTACSWCDRVHQPVDRKWLDECPSCGLEAFHYVAEEGPTCMRIVCLHGCRHSWWLFAAGETRRPGGGRRAVSVTPTFSLDEAAELRRDGWSYRRIGEKYGCAPSTVQRRIDLSEGRVVR